MSAERTGQASREGSARDRILRGIVRALEARPPTTHPGGFPGGAPARPAVPGDLVQRFAEALRRSGGEVWSFAGAVQALAWLQDFASGFNAVAIAQQVPAAFRPELPQVAPQDAHLGVSMALAAGAATGSLVLDSREGRGLQLLPPVHLVWVDARTILPDLGAALEHVRERGPLPAVLALHSGPSKSADIGRIVVTGVHGPGRLVAAILDESPLETSGSPNA